MHLHLKYLLVGKHLLIPFYDLFSVFLIVCLSLRFSIAAFLVFSGVFVVMHLDSLLVFLCVCSIDIFFVLTMGIAYDILKYASLS